MGQKRSLQSFSVHQQSLMDCQAQKSTKTQHKSAMKAVRNPPVRYIPSLLKPYDSFVWGNLNFTELIALKSCIVFMTPVRTQLHSLKKAASWCHRRTFLSKWFHKEPLTSEETFCFTKVYLWQKKGSSDYKKLRKRWFFNLWAFDFMVLCGSKNGSLMASLWRTF